MLFTKKLEVVTDLVYKQIYKFCVYNVEGMQSLYTENIILDLISKILQ